MPFSTSLDTRGRTPSPLSLSGPLPGAGAVPMVANMGGLQGLAPSTVREFPIDSSPGEQVRRIGMQLTPEGVATCDPYGATATRSIYLDEALGRMQASCGVDLRYACTFTDVTSGNGRVLWQHLSSTSATTYNFSWDMLNAARTMRFGMRQANAGNTLVQVSAPSQFPDIVNRPLSLRVVWDPDADSVEFFYFDGLYDDATVWTSLGVASAFMSGNPVMTGLQTSRQAMYLPIQYWPARTIHKVGMGRLPGTQEFTVDFSRIYWERLTGNAYRGEPGACKWTERKPDMGEQYRITQRNFADTRSMVAHNINGEYPLTILEPPATVNYDSVPIWTHWPLDKPYFQKSSAVMSSWTPPADTASLSGLGPFQSSGSNHVGPGLAPRNSLTGAYEGRAYWGSYTVSATAGLGPSPGLLAAKLGPYGVMSWWSWSAANGGCRAAFSDMSFHNTNSTAGYLQDGWNFATSFTGGAGITQGFRHVSHHYSSQAWSSLIPQNAAVTFFADQSWSPVVVHATSRYVMATRPGMRGNFSIVDLSRSWHRAAQDIRRWHEQGSWWGIGNHGRSWQGRSLFMSSDPSAIPTTYDYAAMGSFDGYYTSNAYARLAGHELPLSGPNKAHWEIAAGTADMVLSSNDSAFQWLANNVGKQVVGFRPAGPWFDFEVVGNFSLGSYGVALMWVDANNYLVAGRVGVSTTSTDLKITQCVGGVTTVWSGQHLGSFEGSGILAFVKRQGKLYVYNTFGLAMDPIDTDPYFDGLQGQEFVTGHYRDSAQQTVSPLLAQMALRLTGPNDDWPKYGKGPLPHVGSTVSTTYTAATTTLTSAYPSNWNDGDIIVAICTSASTTDAFSAPWGWRTKADWPSLAADHRTHVFWRKVKSTDTGSVDFTKTGTAGNTRVTLIRINNNPFPLGHMPSAVRASGTTHTTVAANTVGPQPSVLHFGTWLENGATASLSGSNQGQSFVGAAGYPSHAYGYVFTSVASRANGTNEWGTVNMTLTSAAAASVGSMGFGN